MTVTKSNELQNEQENLPPVSEMSGAIVDLLTHISDIIKKRTVPTEQLVIIQSKKLEMNKLFLATSDLVGLQTKLVLEEKDTPPLEKERRIAARSYWIQAYEIHDEIMAML